MNPILEKRLFTVVKNEPLATDTYQLTLAPAEGGTMFPFVAGQWVYLYLLNDDGTEWARAAFSVASAPSESAQQFELAIKVYGGYTTRAQLLHVGDVVRIQGPFGVFTLKPGSEPLVFCAGGIGVTPFRSIIRELAATGVTRPVTLFYSNPTVAAAAYAKELAELAAAHPWLHVVSIYTREEVANAEMHRFDATMLARNVPQFAAANYLMCGPGPFMDSVIEALRAHGLDPKAKLRKELFN